MVELLIVILMMIILGGVIMPVAHLVRTSEKKAANSSLVQRLQVASGISDGAASPAPTDRVEVLCTNFGTAGQPLTLNLLKNDCFDWRGEEP